MSIGEALVKAGLVTKEHLRLALERQVVFGGRIGTNIVELGILKEEELSRFLSEHLKVPAVNRAELMNVDEETIAAIPVKLADKYKSVPFRKEKNRIHVAMLDPKHIQSIEELRFLTGYDIIPYIASELRLLFALERYYGIKRDLRFVSILDRESSSSEPETKKSATEDEGSLGKVKEAFAYVKSREEVAGLLLSESKKVAKRAALFVIKAQEVNGWLSKDLDIKKFKANGALPSIFSDVLMRKTYYRGPVLKIPGNAELIEVLGGTPEDCIMVPVNIRDRIMCLLYADNGTKGVLDANVIYINRLSLMAAFSFELLIIKHKLMEL
jgi:hypothetical protein